MSELSSCDVHFIRCIKPNELKQKLNFVPSTALNQIRYLGVLDSIKVRKESYPIRKLYKHFYLKYGQIFADTYRVNLKKRMQISKL